MKNAIDLPRETDSNTTFIEKSIKDIIDYATTDQNAKSELSERLLSIYKIYQKGYSFDFNIDCPPTVTPSEAAIIEESARENFGQFMKIIHDQMDEIILERFHTEIKLYFLESTADYLTQ